MPDGSDKLSAAPILRLDRVSKRFGGTLAVDGVSLDLVRGEILALPGENGAGKLTMSKMLANLFPADGGRILVDGDGRQVGVRRVDATTPDERELIIGRRALVARWRGQTTGAPRLPPFPTCPHRSLPKLRDCPGGLGREAPARLGRKPFAVAAHGVRSGVTERRE